MFTSILIVLVLVSILFNAHQHRVNGELLRLYTRTCREVDEVDNELFMSNTSLKEVLHELEVVSCALPIHPVFVPEHNAYVSRPNSDGTVSALPPSLSLE